MTAIAFHYAKAAGRFHLDGPYATSVSVNAYQSGAMNWGGVSIVNDQLRFSSQVANVVVDTVTIGGKVVKRAVVTSKAFLFGPELCHCVVEIVAATANGEVGYRIHRNADGSVMDESAPTGLYVPVPLEYGSVSIL